jgi:lipopolysaccharide export system protein LptA
MCKPAWLCAALALLAIDAHAARSPDRDAPMTVNAASQQGGLGDDDAIRLLGDVVIEQGSLRVNADNATVERKAGDIQRIVLEGNPVRMQQTTATGEAMDARARRVVYTMDDEVMVLTGAVEIAQTRGTLRAESVRYNLDTGQVESGGDGTRVQMVIQPKKGGAG